MDDHDACGCEQCHPELHARPAVQIGELRADERGAYVEIRMADCAPAFTVAALDLLAAVEDSDPALITDDALEKATTLREVIETGRW